jgi:hypothetical protein
MHHTPFDYFCGKTGKSSIVIIRLAVWTFRALGEAAPVTVCDCTLP